MNFEPGRKFQSEPSFPAKKGRAPLRGGSDYYVVELRERPRSGESETRECARSAVKTF